MSRINSPRGFSLQYWRHACLAMSLTMGLALTGCGGGSGGDDSARPLTVNAGADVQANEQTTVFLAARTSGQTENLTYRWSASPSIAIIQDDNTSGEASIELPELEEEIIYTVTVSVSGNGETDTDELVITALPVNDEPTAAISADESMQENSRYPAGIQVVLDGSTSSDADASDANNPISKWQWEQLEGADVTEDVALDGPILSIVTPVANSEQQLTFRLTVTDEEGATGSETVTLLVLPGQDTKPTVEAGVNHGVFSGEPIILAGQASSTVPSALPLISEWDASSSVAVDIRDDAALSTYATAPRVDSAQTMTFTLTVTDANGNQVTDAINVTVRPMPVALLNDTGVTIQANETMLTSVQQNDYPGQDGQRGYDVVSQVGLLEKAGRGQAGFDFTKLNANGDEQDADVADWSCVRDNTTGLVWEVKTDDNGLHGGEHTYSWFQSENNGGSEGVESTPEASCPLSGCNTRNFVEEVRDEGLCGFYDWRMPTHFELMSLLHFGNEGQTMIDQTYFPHTGLAASEPLWYWTSQPGADGVITDAAQNAWAVDYLSGVDNFLNKGSVARVRLVRAGR